LHYRLGERWDAVTWSRKASEIFKRVGDISGLASVTGSLADIHEAEGRFDDAIAGYRETLVLIDGRSFHRLAADTRIQLADILIRRKDLVEAGALLDVAELLCQRHRLRGSFSAIEKTRTALDVTREGGQAARHTLSELLASLQELVRHRPEHAVGYLDFWYYAWHAELMTVIRSGPTLTFMAVTDDIDQFLQLATKLTYLG